MENQQNFEDYTFEKHETNQDKLIMEIGDVFTGVYLGKVDSEFYANRFDYKIEFEDIGIKKASGVIMDRHFDSKSKPIPIGAVVKVKYLGKPAGKKYDNYEISVGVKK